MGKVRDYILSARQVGRAIHQTAGSLAAKLGMSVGAAAEELDSLVKAGLLESRVWVHCPECHTGVMCLAAPGPQDPLPLTCGECSHTFLPENTERVYVLLARSPTSVGDLEQLLPGPDLDRLVAEARGMVPCEGWVPPNLGSAGGPVLMGTLCFHASGACWSTATTGGGTIGGVPRFSTQRQHLSLADLPHGTTLRYDGYAWYVRVPGIMELHAKTEAHAVSLALLAAQQPPKWTDATRWQVGWREYAAENGINPDDAPWTPELVHVLRSYAQTVARDACQARLVSTTRPPSKEAETFRNKLNAVPTEILTRIVERARQDGVAEAAALAGHR